MSNTGKKWLPGKGALIVLLLLFLSSCASKESRIRAEKESLAHYKLGVAHIHGKQPDPQKAYVEFQKAVKINPKNKNAHYGLGHLHFQGGNYKDAILSFKKAISIDTQYAEAHNYLGTVYKVEGKLDEAIIEYKEAIKNPTYETPENPHFNLALIYFQQGNYDLADEEIQAVLQTNPNFLDAHLLLAHIYRNKGSEELAKNAFEKIIAISPQSPQAKESKKLLQAAPQD